MNMRISQPLPGEVRVKVQLAGICGSDVHIYRGHNPFAKYPRVIGHEFFGVVDAVGRRFADKLGKRVSVDPGHQLRSLLSLPDWQTECL